MKLHATLICKKRLQELGWEVKLEHQDEQHTQTHWRLNTNIPYRSYSWPRYTNGVLTHWCYGVEYSKWKLNFNRKKDLVEFLKRYYPHHVNFWDFDALEDAIVYEDDNIYKALHRPYPYRNRRFW